MGISSPLKLLKLFKLLKPPLFYLYPMSSYTTIRDYLISKGLTPFPYQEQAWEAIKKGQSGLINAPTGYGKTYAVFLGWVMEEGLRGSKGLRCLKSSEESLRGLKSIERNLEDQPLEPIKLFEHLKPLLWLSPLRSLATDIARAMEEVIHEMGLPLTVGIRNGDTPIAERQRQKKKLPHILIVTPESLHLLLAQKGYEEYLGDVGYVAVDEWHELLGSKRGVQVELALSRLAAIRKKKGDPLSVWGLSATIGNLEEAREVLLAPLGIKGITITAPYKKKVNIIPLLPEQIEKYPWAGHLGLKMAKEVVNVIKNEEISKISLKSLRGLRSFKSPLSPFQKSPLKPIKPFEPLKPSSSLLFINTRGMAEQWYQTLLTTAPELAGSIALHHGSIEKELRDWVENALHNGTLTAVVCTSSLDLGVDFRPVDKVVQVGSPKGVARFLQRAGRSGHRPGAESTIYFLPTHSMELLEAAALKEAMQENIIESRIPLILCYDVLLQYLCTLAVSDGFDSDTLYIEVTSTHCFRDLDRESWKQLLEFLTMGGKALKEYDEYRKVVVEDGIYKITDRRIAFRHRLHIGTIVSDSMLKVKLITGKFIGMVEEYFISRLQPGEVFTLAGRNLEFVMIKDMTVIARKSQSKKSKVPSWNGGRLPLSINLGKMLRKKLDDAGRNADPSPEVRALQPLFDLQRQLSAVPAAGELLIEHIETDRGYHLFVYPFEGRLVHEAMAALLAWRISQKTPISFSMAMNDYGFELLSDRPIPVDDDNVKGFFSEENLLAHIQAGVNATEMAKRKFRDIAVIGGLIFQGMPGKYQKPRHLQSSAGLLFDVFSNYDPDNLLIRQAYEEVMNIQMDEPRLRDMLRRIQKGKIVITRPEKITPFCFSILVDGMREHVSSEKLEDRVRKMLEG